MEKNIAVIWGDCSSPEIVKQTLRVLDKVAEKYGHTFHYTAAAMGGEAIDKYGDPLPQHELDKCLAADSVLLGAVGGPKWEGLPRGAAAGKRPAAAARRDGAVCQQPPGQDLATAGACQPLEARDRGTGH